MNELNKLIEQAFDDEVSAENMFGAMEILCGKEAFIERVNEILATRPTCGKEQRLFLDEVEKFRIEKGLGIFCGNEIVYLSKNFNHLNIEKVIEGK